MVLVSSNGDHPQVEPLFSGGGQERNIRSGTVPTPLVVGLGAACDVAMHEMQRDAARIRKLYNRLYEGITKVYTSFIIYHSWCS